MEIGKILFRRELKLVTLLLTSLLIASSSAAVYYSMVMEPTVTTATADVKFIAGNDSAPAGATGGSLTDSWVRLASLKAYPNTSLTYDQAVNVSNTGSAHQFKLTHVSITNGTSAISNFISITFKLVAKNGSEYVTFVYDNADGDTYWGAPPSMNYIDILAGENWAVKVITKAKASASPGQVCAIMINVDVK